MQNLWLATALIIETEGWERTKGDWQVDRELAWAPAAQGGMCSVGLPNKNSLSAPEVQDQKPSAAGRGKDGQSRQDCLVHHDHRLHGHPYFGLFKQNNYFGLDAENVFIFQQSTLPCFTFEGTIILGEKGALSRAPDGNGGLYKTLRNVGVLTDMTMKGIKFVQLYCVDIVLVK